MSYTLPWTVNKFVSTNINNADSITGGTFGNVSLKVGGKTQLVGNTVVEGKLGVGGAVSSNALEVNGTVNATALQSVKITPTNRPELSTNRYIGANLETINWEDPQNIIFNGTGNWTTYLPSVTSGGIARVGSRFTFGFTINWTGTKRIEAQSTQYIYDGGSLVNSISVSITSSTQHYIELLCVNYAANNICWTVINKAYQYSLPANVTFNSGITASQSQTITFGTNAPTMAGTNVSGVVKTTGTETVAGLKTFSNTLTTTDGITASTAQTINFGTNAPTMAGTNISGIPDAALSSNIPLKNATNTFTNTNTINPTTTAITINNFNFATPAQSTNDYTELTDAGNWTTAVTIYNWTFKSVLGTAPTIRIGNGFTPFVNLFPNQYPEYPLFTQYISFNNNSVTSLFRLTQNLTFATTGSYILTMHVFGEYNRYSPTQSVTTYVNTGNGEVLSGFTTIEGGWSKLVFKFDVPIAGTKTFYIEINSTNVDSGLSISGIQIVKQSGLIVSNGTNANNQLITPFGSYTSGSLYNNGSIYNNGQLKNYGPLSLFLPYSAGSSVIGSSSYGMNILDTGKYNVLIGQQVAAAATPSQALNINSCVAIGYAALEQGGLSTNGISRCIGIGFQANRWNGTQSSTNCDDNCGVGYQSGAGLGYSGTNSARNCTFGNYVLAGALGDSNDNSSFGHNSMSSYTTSSRSYNSCFGGSSLINCVSSYNSCLGYGNAPNMVNTASNYNTFIGSQVCPSQSGSTNVLLNCTFLGSASDVSTAGNYANSTCVGYNSRITGNNQLILGTGSETTYAMGGLNIPVSKTLTLLGDISANSQTVTPAQVANLNRIYIETDISNNIAFAATPTGGNTNYAFGSQSMNGALTTGNQNLSCGASALRDLTSGTSNTAISHFSLASLTSGSFNTCCGFNSGAAQEATNYNTFFGYNAGSNSAIVNYCSAFGASITFSTNTSFSTAIGYGVNCTASNQIKIGRASETTVFDGGVVLNNGLTATGTQTITFGTNAPTMAGTNVSGVVKTTGTETVAGLKTFSDTLTTTSGITASAVQTINFGTNAPTMSGANISATSIPDSALSANIPLKNASNTFTGLNAINNQYVHKAYGSLVSATTALVSLSSIIYEFYSISTTSNITITLPVVTATNVGQQITFRRVGGTTTTVISFAINGSQLVYNTALTGSTTNALMGSGTYIVKLVGLLVTGTTYAYFQI